jgi:hypothetical protein
MLRSILLFLLICALTVISVFPARRTQSERKHGLEVIFAKWIPGKESLSVDKFEFPQPDSEMEKMTVTESELRQLKSLGLTTGRIYVGRRQVEGSGDLIRVLVVLKHQVKSPAVLWQPKEADVIYFQDKNEWKLFPSNAALSGRFITLEADKRDPRVTMCWIEDFDGGRTGGQAVSW